MANTRSAGKRSRQTQRRALRNRSVKAHLRSLQKRIRPATKPSADEIRAVISAIDKAAKRGTIHRNAAKRRTAIPRSAVAESEDGRKVTLATAGFLDPGGMMDSIFPLHILLAG
jgi:small subunit ribosomal protein S20